MSPCKLLPFCVALALTGCSLAPDYQRPAMPVPQQFSLSQNGLVNAADNYQNAGWRTFFVDNQVKTLISEALVNNRDLRMAALKVQEARAQYRLTDADRYPQLNGEGSGSWAAILKAIQPRRGSSRLALTPALISIFRALKEHERSRAPKLFSH